jgi:hypothetical protein
VKYSELAGETACATVISAVPSSVGQTVSPAMPAGGRFFTASGGAEVLNPRPSFWNSVLSRAIPRYRISAAAAPLRSRLCRGNRLQKSGLNQVAHAAAIHKVTDNAHVVLAASRDVSIDAHPVFLGQ